MGRLKQEFVDRLDRFCDRVVDVAEAPEKQKRHPRIVDQMIGAGTSVGANAAEADEAISRADFCKCLGTSRRELGETRYWLRMTARRQWVAPRRLAPLQAEAMELTKVLGAIVAKSRDPRKRND